MMQKKPRIRTDSRIFQIAGVVLFWLGCAEVWSESEFTKQVRELAEQGSAEAQNNLGFMYQQGEWGVPQDDAKAVKWYRLAAD